ncbi:lycopene cyclase family protein [Nocardia cyriacigeorgica]|uniref:lycopene cyclase family protein n=1 Tax=Nocardia cyriacigeorgica TaxID=135487 RepID=UPI001893AF79|nr:lycopene cyclase family protein [Nocardia cyriacigeorgica]MBF6440310.1 lycopene cyclase [Nocardia cyriacigeorgica]MBF6457116.1 lycopene cyclase [Nocardia cyriacigeorgica]MBF6478698.1 lycopene cyclase [Nocardia cyriacigeorgica]MBF6554223.1 lycopene cyclase [Nocardia cyriacigeorgica]
MTARTDVVVCGLGPAGRALAHRCLAHGLSVAVVDPAPRRHWTATYAAWADELPEWLDPGVIAATVDRPVAWGAREHRIERRYVVLDSERLRSALDITGSRVLADRAVRLTAHTVTLASGTVLRAERVIDARGLARASSRAEQTAFGVVVAAERAAGVEPLFMDWRPDNGAPAEAPRSFLYAVPLGAGAMLMEETCLAGRPALGQTELAARLHRRLRARGIRLDGGERVERVRFPVTGARPGRFRFGAAGGFIHQATGYSVAAALTAADAVVAGGSPAPPAARVVHGLREAGLRALLRLPPADLPVFFDTFFDLPEEWQRAYLSGRTDVTGTAAAMGTLFARLPARLRTRIAAATLRLPFDERGRRDSSMMG